MMGPAYQALAVPSSERVNGGRGVPVTAVLPLLAARNIDGDDQVDLAVEQVEGQR
jgi:hypothetical protein